MEDDGDSETADDTAFYYASIPVWLAAVPGSVLAFDPTEWSPDASSAEAVAARSSPGGGLPPELHDVVVPAVPSLDLVRCTSGSGGVGAPALPPELRAPLIKVPAPASATSAAASSAPPLLRGYASGVRSALVRLRGGTWYRLKGCGAGDAGFPVRRSAGAGGAAPWRDIRGCAFPREAATELAMSARLSSALAAHSSLCANGAAALVLYGGAAQLPLGTAVPTACIVATTLGDRRLGTHVLAGLELLLPRLLDAALVDTAALGRAFPPARPRAGGAEPWRVVPTAQFVEDHVLACSEAFMSGAAPARADAGWSWTAARDASTLASIVGGDLEASLARSEAAAAAAASALPPPPQFTAAGARAMPPAWCARWARTCAELHAAHAAAPRGASPLGYLYARLGYDAGCIIAGLRAAGVCWGTYQDAMCARELGAWHCNAHSNNLIVVAEGALPTGALGAQRLLAALDFDMAFDARSHVDAASGSVGVAPELFARLLDFERVSMLSVLAGADTTSGVPMGVLAAVREATSPLLEAVKSALTDTLVRAYAAGCDGTLDGVPPFDAKLHRAAHALMRAAIAVMADYVA